MNDFWMGAMAAASWAAALFFLKFWHETHDRLFAFFSFAFLLLGLTRLGRVVLSDAPVEGHTFLYWIRLAAFLLILIAIIDKNRR